MKFRVSTSRAFVAVPNCCVVRISKILARIKRVERYEFMRRITGIPRTHFSHCVLFILFTRLRSYRCSVQTGCSPSFNTSVMRQLGDRLSWNPFVAGSAQRPRFHHLISIRCKVCNRYNVWRRVDMFVSCDGLALRRRLPRVELRNVLHRLCILFISNGSGLPCKTDLISGIRSHRRFSVSQRVIHSRANVNKCKSDGEQFCNDARLNVLTSSGRWRQIRGKLARESQYFGDESNVATWKRGRFVASCVLKTW